MRNAFVGLMLPMTLVASANAEPTAAQGAGSFTCAQFAEDYRGSPDLSEVTFFTWAQGYMSGLNVSLPKGVPFRNLAGSPTSDEEGFIRNYCDKHPLELYMDAVEHLYWTLPAIPPGPTKR